MEINFLLQFSYNSRKQKKNAILKLCKLFTHVLVNLPFFPKWILVDFWYVVWEHLASHLLISDFLLQLL